MKTTTNYLTNKKKSFSKNSLRKLIGLLMTMVLFITFAVPAVAKATYYTPTRYKSVVSTSWTGNFNIVSTGYYYSDFIYTPSVNKRAYITITAQSNLSLKVKIYSDVTGYVGSVNLTLASGQTYNVNPGTYDSAYFRFENTGSGNAKATYTVKSK